MGVDECPGQGAPRTQLAKNDITKLGGAIGANRSIAPLAQPQPPGIGESCLGPHDGDDRDAHRWGRKAIRFARCKS